MAQGCPVSSRRHVKCAAAAAHACCLRSPTPQPPAGRPLTRAQFDEMQTCSQPAQPRRPQCNDLYDVFCERLCGRGCGRAGVVRTCLALASSRHVNLLAWMTPGVVLIQSASTCRLPPTSTHTHLPTHPPTQRPSSSQHKGRRGGARAHHARLPVARHRRKPGRAAPRGRQRLAARADAPLRRRRLRRPRAQRRGPTLSKMQPAFKDGMQSALIPDHVVRTNPTPTADSHSGPPLALLSFHTRGAMPVPLSCPLVRPAAPRAPPGSPHAALAHCEAAAAGASAAPAADAGGSTLRGMPLLLQRCAQVLTAARSSATDGFASAKSTRV